MPSDPTILPYGSWPSPITLDLVVAAGRSAGAPWLDGDDLYALEARPSDGGRLMVIRRTPDGTFHDAIPTGFNVRSRVHEYGGGAYTVARGVLVFSNFADNLLYRGNGPDAAPSAITSSSAHRFADPVLDLARDRVIAILEDHTLSDADPVNAVAAVSLADGTITTLAGGHDFFSDPRLDPDGRRLCWITWDRPNMPWDGTELWVADIAPDGSLTGHRLVAGGTDEAVLNPTWAPDGSLLFTSDRSGWWNPYRWREGSAEAQPLAPMSADIGDALWVFGQRWIGVDADGTVALVARTEQGDQLHVVDPDGSVRHVPVDATEIGSLLVHGGAAWAAVGGPARPSALSRIDLRDGTETVLHVPSPLTIDPAYLSVPRHVVFPSEGGRTAHAWYYPPTNPDAAAPAGELPPLVVATHGGPTSNAMTALDLQIQAFTSRGFAFVDVDYGGSTGYGRAYRNLLRRAWGVVDLEDVTAAATWLGDQGLADPARLVIRGGSAGGYTTLAALAFRDRFAAGASYFGVGDLEALAKFTHKFESRYLDLIVGPYPDDVERYRDLSPIHAVGRISCPVLVLQGEEDRIVPKEQAEEIVAALAERGLPHAYLLFPEEGHGFRKPENRRRALESELSFYGQVFGFDLAGDITPLELVRPER
ncbi:MAG: S9 family peptidase [Chloroflexota bacterium]